MAPHVLLGVLASKLSSFPLSIIIQKGLLRMFPFFMTFCSVSTIRQKNWKLKRDLIIVKYLPLAMTVIKHR